MAQAIQTGTAHFAANKIVVVNGPNLGRLGVREPDVYGHQDLKQLRQLCVAWAKEYGFEVDVRQSDDEAEVIGWMHQAVDRRTPGLPLMEVHISNPAGRESFRRLSVISPIATGTITGMGFYGYKLAIESIAVLIQASQQA